MRGESAFDLLRERRPGVHITEVSNGLGAVGIIHPQDRGLREYVGAAETRRMQVVAFNLGGTAEMAFDQQWIRISAKRERGGVIHRDARNDLLWLADIR